MSSALAKKRTPQSREEMLEQTVDDIRGKFGQGSIMRLGDSARTNVEVIPSGIERTAPSRGKNPERPFVLRTHCKRRRGS